MTMATTYPEPWSRIFGGDEPESPPPDPQSLDATRPEDIDDCSMCMGEGLVDDMREGEPVDVLCWVCGGTGLVPPC